MYVVGVLSVVYLVVFLFSEVASARENSKQSGGWSATAATANRQTLEELGTPGRADAHISWKKVSLCLRNMSDFFSASLLSCFVRSIVFLFFCPHRLSKAIWRRGQGG